MENQDMGHPNIGQQAATAGAATGKVKFGDFLICTFFGIGKIPFAPGTFGTAAAFILVLAIAYAAKSVYSNPLVFLTVIFLLWALLFVFAFDSVKRYLAGSGRQDPKEIVIDEVLGFMLAFVLSLSALILLHKVPSIAKTGLINAAVSPYYHLTMFLLFRLFDIWKPGIIGKMDQQNSAKGVIMDDIWSGLFTAVSLTAMATVYYLL